MVNFSYKSEKIEILAEICLRNQRKSVSRKLKLNDGALEMLVE